MSQGINTDLFDFGSRVAALRLQRMLGGKLPPASGSALEKLRELYPNVERDDTSNAIDGIRLAK